MECTGLRRRHCWDIYCILLQSLQSHMRLRAEVRGSSCSKSCSHQLLAPHSMNTERTTMRDLLLPHTHVCQAFYNS
jgi:hypothetical protein